MRSQMTSASAPMGRLIQKISVQDRCCAKKPPTAGPATLEVAQTMEI